MGLSQVVQYNIEQLKLFNTTSYNEIKKLLWSINWGVKLTLVSTGDVTTNNDDKPIINSATSLVKLASPSHPLDIFQKVNLLIWFSIAYAELVN